MELKLVDGGTFFLGGGGVCGRRDMGGGYSAGTGAANTPGLGTGQLHGGECRPKSRAKTFQGRMDGLLPKRLHGPRGRATAFLAGTRRF